MRKERTVARKLAIERRVINGIKANDGYNFFVSDKIRRKQK